MSDIDESVIRFELLGPLRAWCGDVELKLGPSQQRVVLAVLLLHANRSLSRQGLIEAVWGPEAPAQAVNMLQKHISGLRRVLERAQPGRPTSRLPDWTGTGYFLTVPAGSLDLQVFDGLVDQARAARAAGELARAAEAFHAALREWRGTPFEGLTSPLLASERSRLSERRIDVVEDRIKVDLAMGVGLDLVAELRHLVAAHPFRERMRSLLMLALYQSDRRAEAFAAFRDARRHLHDELGVEPSTQLQQLHQRMLDNDPTLVPANPTKAAVRTASGTPQVVEVRPLPSAADRLSSAPGSPASVTGSQLVMVPAPTGFIVPRESLVHELVKHLIDAGCDAVRIVAAVGPGGFGKTTLVMNACWRAEVRTRFSDGILWVTVGERTDGPGLTSKINDLSEHLCGVRPSLADPLQAGFHLGQLLGERRVLLVIDDVWRPSQLTPFLQGSPYGKRLVTTRDRRVLPVPALRVEVDAMTRHEAHQLLTAGLPDIRPNQVSQLLTSTGSWPLLLALVNSHIRILVQDRGETVEQAIAEVVEELQTAGPTALDVTDPVERRQAVASTLNATLELLHDPDPTRSRTQRYVELAVFPEECDIPRQVLERYWAASAGWNATQVRKFCDELAALSLVRSYDAQPPRLRLHAVVRRYLWHRAGDRLSAMHAVLLDGYRHRLSEDDGWHSMSATEQYMWVHLGDHLHQAGRLAELERTVTDLRYLACKTMNTDALAVESDLALASGETAVALRKLIARSTHLLRSDDQLSMIETTLVSRTIGTPGLADVVDAHPWMVPAPRLVATRPLPDLPDPRLDRVLLAGGEPVRSVRFSPDGRLVASTGSDRTVRVWDVASGAQRHILTGHTDWIGALAFSPNGQLLVSAGNDDIVRLWETASGSLRAALCGHSKAVKSVAFHPSKGTLASSDTDGVVRVWATGSANPLFVLAGHRGPVWCVKFSPDGTVLVSAGDDGTVCIWDADTGTLKCTLSGHSGPVQTLSFSATSPTIASAGRDGTIRFWDSRNGEARRILAGHATAVRSVSFSPSGHLLASASWDGTVRIWNISNGLCLHTLDNHLLAAEDVAFSPDGSILASAAGGGTIHLWSVLIGEEVTALTGHVKSIPAISFSPDGRYLASASWDGSVRLWRPMIELTNAAASRGSAHKTGSEGFHRAYLAEAAARDTDREPMKAVACSPKGDLFAVAGASGAVRLRDTVSGLDRGTLGEVARLVQTLAFSPGGTLVAYGGAEGMIVVFPMSAHSTPYRLTGHALTVRAVAFSPDGQRLASAGDDGAVRIWSLASHSLTRSWSAGADRILTLAWSPDGRLIAVAGDDGILRLLDAEKGTTVRSLASLTLTVTAVAFDVDGTHLVAGGHGGVIRLWNLTTGANQVLAGHELGVDALAFHPSGAYLASAGQDGTIRLWSVRTGMLITGLRADGPLCGLAWTPDGRRLAAVGGRGTYLFSCRYPEEGTPENITSLIPPASERR